MHDPVVFESETLEKCQKAIESEGPKFEKKVFGALKKCTDLYRAAVTDGDPLAEPATKCDAALSKVLLFPDPAGKSAIAKAKVKLDSLSDPAKIKCSDVDLLALGHLPVGTFGDLWARLTLVRRIGAAITSQVSAIRDTPDIFRALAAAGCTRCGVVSQPPCFETTCNLAVGSTTEFIGAGLVAPSGALNLSVCRYADVLGADYGLFAAPARGVDPFNITAANDGYFCGTAIGGEGYIAGPGSSLKQVASETCQDHINGDTDECPAALLPATAICAAPAADTKHAGVTNSGACAGFQTGAAATGDAFLLASYRISQACDGGALCGGVDQRGADGLACTADDTGPVGSTFPLPLTTYTATTEILDANNVNATTLLLTTSPTGAVFDPVKVSGGDLSGGKIVGALPALHTVENNPSPDSDSAFDVELVCG